MLANLSLSKRGFLRVLCTWETNRWTTNTVRSLQLHVWMQKCPWNGAKSDWLISWFRSCFRTVLMELSIEVQPHFEHDRGAMTYQGWPHRASQTSGHFSRIPAVCLNGLSQPTLSWAIPAVLDRNMQMSAMKNKSPMYTVVDQANIKPQFAARTSFPNGIGAINCKHSGVQGSAQDEFVDYFGWIYEEISIVNTHTGGAKRMVTLACKKPRIYVFQLGEYQHTTTTESHLNP